MAVQTLSRTPSIADLIQVPVSAIVPDRVVGVPLYIDDRDRVSGCKLYRGHDYPLTLRDLGKLAQGGTTHLLIDAEDRAGFQQYLREGLSETIADDSLTGERRFSVLNQVVRDVLGECFEQGDDEQTVTQTRDLGRHTVDLICQRDVVASGLTDVLCHDYHTFTHSTNVAFYCVMLSQELGIDDRDSLEDIAVAGFLHDLGKLEISKQILTKPGKLDDEEFAVIKRHPTIGFRRLAMRPDLSLGQLMMVYQHHERLDGKGYPVGVTAPEIHDWARICTVCDVFEALTSNRPYRRGMSHGDAFAIMDRGNGTQFDEGMYQCWKSIIKSR